MIEPKPIAVQLASLHEECKEDFKGVLQAVAGIGFLGIELSGFHGTSPLDLRMIVEDLGMVVTSSHGPWPAKGNLNEIKDTAFALGTETIICSYESRHFQNETALRETAEEINFIIDDLETAGLSLAIHNHYWEFHVEKGKTKYESLLALCPSLLCELDVYWAASFGEADPVKVTSKYAERTTLLHLRDGPQEKDQPCLALGSGNLDIPAVIEATDPYVLKWVIVDSDRANSDRAGSDHVGPDRVDSDHPEPNTLDVLTESYNYLTVNQLAKDR